MIIKISEGVILSVYGMIVPYLQSWRKARAPHLRVGSMRGQPPEPTARLLLLSRLTRRHSFTYRLSVATMTVE